MLEVSVKLPQGSSYKENTKSSKASARASVKCPYWAYSTNQGTSDNQLVKGERL